ncbi:MAG: TlpA family protein disulfide reductase [Stenotrophomonas maltophilia]
MAQIFRWFSSARQMIPRVSHPVNYRFGPAVRRPQTGFKTIAALPLGIVLALALAACSRTSVSTNSSPTNSPDPAPTVGAVDLTTPSSTTQNPNDFAFTLYQGQERLGAESLNFSDLQGKPVVLNFWAGLCPPCRAEMPDLQKFYDDYSDKVVLLGIDVGQFTSLGNRDDAKALLKELGVTYPAGFTEDPAIMRNFRVLGMPTTVFIDSEGKTFRSWTGALNQKTLSEITDEMLAQ